MCTMDRDAGSTVIDQKIPVSNPGGRDTWGIVSHNVIVKADTNYIGIAAAFGGWNFKRFRICSGEKNPVRAMDTYTANVSPTPNPFINMLNVDFGSADLLRMPKLYIVTGLLIKSVKVHNVIEVQIDINEFETGICFIKEV